MSTVQSVFYTEKMVTLIKTMHNLKSICLTFMKAHNNDKCKDKALVKVELIKLGSGGRLLETLLVALPVDVTYAAVACLQAK